jgi:hypothetical protein
MRIFPKSLQFSYLVFASLVAGWEGRRVERALQARRTTMKTLVMGALLAVTGTPWELVCLA